MRVSYYTAAGVALAIGASRAGATSLTGQALTYEDDENQKLITFAETDANTDIDTDANTELEA